MQQGDVSAAVGVVFDRGDLGRDSVLATLKVDLAVETLGAATTMARGLAATSVTATALRQTLNEAFFRLVARDLSEVGVGRETTTRAGWLWLTNRHYSTPSASPWKIGICSPART